MMYLRYLLREKVIKESDGDKQPGKSEVKLEYHRDLYDSIYGSQAGGFVDYGTWHRRRIAIARDREHSKNALTMIRAELEAEVSTWDDPVNPGSKPIIVGDLAAPQIGFVVSTPASSNEVRLVLEPNAPYIVVLPNIKGSGDNGRTIRQILSTAPGIVNINTPTTAKSESV